MVRSLANSNPNPSHRVRDLRLPHPTIVRKEAIEAAWATEASSANDSLNFEICLPRWQILGRWPYRPNGTGSFCVGYPWIRETALPASLRT